MDWHEVPEAVARWAERSAAPARAVKAATAGLFTRDGVGFYYHPEYDRYAVAGQLGPGEESLCASALGQAGGALTQTMSSPRAALDGGWVKLAYSPSLRKAMEYLNFFEGQYPGGIPNAPSPVAAMITAALVGGGLGYGAGWLGKKLMPRRFGDKLPRTGAILGGLAGAAPGAAWGYANIANDKSVLSGWPFAGQPPSDSPADQQSNFNPDEWSSPASFAPWAKLSAARVAAIDDFVKRAQWEGEDLYQVASGRQRTPLDVNINHLGQALWRSGAGPPLIGTTMSTLYAASRVPDEEERPGWVTGHQLGRLALGAGKDYATGLAFGALANLAVGTPYSAPAFGLGTAAVGLVRAGLSGLFR